MSTNALGQQKKKDTQREVSELIQIAETYYPLNDEYINGFPYAVPDSRIEGSPYFGSGEWLPGSLYVHGREYREVFLKYDLIIDGLVIKAKTEQNIDRILLVNRSQIDSFSTDGFVFVNSDRLLANSKFSTYYEKIVEGNLSVYKRYTKRYIDSYSGSNLLGKYSATRSNLFLFDGKQMINIDNRKTFLGYFTKIQQDLLKEYLKNKRVNYRNITRQQLAELMAFCNNHFSE